MKYLKLYLTSVDVMSTFVINCDGGIFFKFFATVSTSGCNLFCGLEIVGEMYSVGLWYTFYFLGLSTNGLKKCFRLYLFFIFDLVFPYNIEVSGNFYVSTYLSAYVNIYLLNYVYTYHTMFCDNAEELTVCYCDIAWLCSYVRRFTRRFSWNDKTMIEVKQLQTPLWEMQLAADTGTITSSL